MKKIGLILLPALITFCSIDGQIGSGNQVGLVFHGIVMDATTLKPLPNSQISINRSFNSVSDKDGIFSFRVSRRDTVIFSLLGYKTAVFHVSDTLAGYEFTAGIYLQSDTISIGEVVIIPRLSTLKYDILNKPPSTDPEIENARYNVAVSAYQGKMNQGKLGDPSANYNILHQQQRIEAYERGGIPSDRIIGLSPFMILPAAYLLLNGLPSKPSPVKITLTKQEIEQIHKKYLETIRKKE